MKCPACKGSTLQTTSLESDLKAAHCPACAGKWIAADDYWHWLTQQGETLPEKEPEGIPVEPAAHQQAKLCPNCQRIMLRYKVGHGLNFRLDQCGSCNGIWFDAKEWEALKQRNLHDEVHLIFSAPWQSQIRKDETRQLLDGIYAQTFKKDYAKIQELKAWLDGHPQRAAILDYVASLDPYVIQ
ncbi:MAG: zf-TFIIB domain-containing protein [Cyanobacteria bacterium P01_G01_bin.54]